MNTERPEFVVDNMLRGLAKWLRFLGFSTFITENVQNAQNYLHQHPTSIFLTSSSDHLKELHHYKGYAVKGKHIPDQLLEVDRQFHIYKKINLFSICSLCNVTLEPISVEKVMERIPEGVRKNVKEFHICPECQRIYWLGSHIQRLMNKMKRMGIPLP